MSDHFIRAQLVGVQVLRLTNEARSCTDPERLDAILNELEILNASLLTMREEQLLSMLAKPKRRWWRRRDA